MPETSTIGHNVCPKCNGLTDVVLTVWQPFPEETTREIEEICHDCGLTTPTSLSSTNAMTHFSPVGDALQNTRTTFWSLMALPENDINADAVRKIVGENSISSLLVMLRDESKKPEMEGKNQRFDALKAILLALDTSPG